MDKFTFIVELDKLELFFHIIEKNNCVFEKYHEVSTGRIAVVFSYKSIGSLFMVAHSLGKYSNSFVKN